MEDIITSVATGLGWSHRNDYGIIRTCIPSLGVFYTSSKPGCSLLYIAAYAKAEMAKRGWTLTRFDHPHRLAARMFDRMERTDPHLYDPTDPISVAEAELRCIADALQSNDQDQRGA